jgi:hypothetical protein
MKLGFIVAGVQKAGTTALFEYLRKHPQLSAPSRKELHYFDNEAIDWRLPNYEQIDQFFRHPGIRFEATPIYLFWPNALERIMSYHAQIRLILLFRDPIDRAYSQWCMEFARGDETLSFHDAIRSGRERLRSEDRRSKAYRHWTYVERGFYGRQVADLLDLVPREQALFLRSDDLELEPRKTLDRITSFLSIDEFDAVLPHRFNQRRHVTYPDLLRETDIAFLRNLFRQDTELFADLSGLDVSSWRTLTTT